MVSRKPRPLRFQLLSEDEEELRRDWLDPARATAAELRKRTLYYERPTWLAKAHSALDLAVFAA